MKRGDYMSEVERILADDDTPDALKTEIARLVELGDAFTRQLATVRAAWKAEVEATLAPLGDDDPADRYAEFERLLDALGRYHPAWQHVRRACNEHGDEESTYYALKRRVYAYMDTFGYGLPGCLEDDEDGNPGDVISEDVPF